MFSSSYYFGELLVKKAWYLPSVLLEIEQTFTAYDMFVILQVEQQLLPIFYNYNMRPQV